MTTAAIYARVSTSEQAEKGYSIDTQLDACRSAAKALGATKIVEYIDNGYSGEYLDRPNMDRLREDLKHQRYEYVVCYDPDRLARNLAHQLIVTDEIEKSGASLKFVSVSFEKSPEGKLFYSIRGAISDYEKEKIKERTMRGMRGKARTGKLTHNDKPLGYDFDDSNEMYTVNETEAVIIRKIFELCTNSHDGSRTIARKLNLLGFKTKNGKSFYMSAVLRILSNPMYKGSKMAFRHYDKQVGQHKTKRIVRDSKDWIEIPVPAIVDEETWDKAQKIIQDNKVLSSRNTKRQYLLAGLIKCGYCHRAMVGINYVANGYEYRYYICGGRRNDKTDCPNRYVSMEKLDQDVWEALYQAAKSRNEFPKIEQNSEDDALRDRMVESINELKTRQSAIVKWVRDGMIDVAQAEKDLQSIKKEIDLATVTLNSLSSRPKPSIVPGEILRAETFEEKRSALRKWGAKVYVKRDETGQISWVFGR